MKSELPSQLQKSPFADLEFLEKDTARIMGVLLALAGDYFVLKTEVECLRRALIKRGHINEDDLSNLRMSAEFRRWMEEEARDSGRWLLRPFSLTDEAQNVTKLMEEK